VKLDVFGTRPIKRNVKYTYLSQIEGRRMFHFKPIQLSYIQSLMV